MYGLHVFGKEDRSHPSPSELALDQVSVGKRGRETRRDVIDHQTLW